MVTEGTKPKRKRSKRVLIAIGALIVVLAVGFFAYVSDYYHADDEALAAVADEDGAADGVTVQTLPDGEIAFVPERTIAGLIFYPGGKVQPEAYAPLLTMCAREGILCVLVKPPFNLAIFDTDAADGIAAQFPEVDAWLIGGHSLGGVSASMYLADHAEDFAGIVFLAAYPDDDLSGTSLEALSIVGSNDGVLDLQKYAEAEANMPPHAQELVIDGGNHANFGNYGAQSKDGEAGISREDQQAQAADAIADLACR
ncbi:MAG: alpha/beta hydrolase [bacterium]|nr:alpha/beta hydrolase [bacterium]